MKSYNWRKKSAFTLIELMIVIVVMGIVGKYGIELLIQAYDYYILNAAQNRFQVQSQTAVEQAAARLQYRIPETLVVRQTAVANGIGGLEAAMAPIASAVDAGGDQITALEWIGYDIDGWRGDGTSTNPTWSGIIDVDNPAAIAAGNYLVSPGSDTGRITSVIGALSNTALNQDAAVMFYIGDKNINVMSGYGLDRTVINDQTRNIHRLVGNANVNEFVANGGAFAGTDVYEYYRLAWSAYALVHDKSTGNLWLYYDYRPWLGDNLVTRNDGSVTPHSLLMENVDTFRFRSIGDAMKLQICIKDQDLFDNASKEFAVCKEKTIF